MISVKVTGSFNKTLTFLNRCASGECLSSSIIKYAEAGLKALKENTPVKTGYTANSWSYNIITKKGKTIIQYENSNVVKGQNIAILLQYGHGTKNGGYVQGIDYINPALKPIFDKIADTAWKEMTK